MDKKTKDKLKHLDLDSSKIPDKETRSCVSFLLDGVEQFAQEVESLTEENQHLKDEINRLKGEQGKPNILPQKKNDGDISSEKERKNPLQEIIRNEKKRKTS